MSVGLDGGRGAASGLTEATFTFDPDMVEIAGLEALGSGGSMGSKDALAVGAVDGGRCRLEGKVASDTTGGTGVGGVFSARSTAGGGAAQPQSNGTSLLIRSIRPS
jgi:hypothetical protein